MLRFTGLFALIGIAFFNPAAAEDFMAPLPEDAFKAEVESIKASFDNTTRAAVTPEEVGDADSFRRNVKWLGLLSGFISLQTDCTPPPGELPDPSCITMLPAPGVTNFNAPDIASITIPGRSSKSLFCHWQTPVVTYFAINNTGSTQTTQFRVTPSYRIENEVLNDPALTDPNTGLPLGGAIELPISAINVAQGIAPGEIQREDFRGTRACIAGLVNKRNLQSAYGLSNAQVRRFFRKPTTITMSLSGNASMLDIAVINFGTRIMGD